jgi:hypothetical protein
MFTLNEIGGRLRTQDNRCTKLPIFVVERKRRTYGLDPDYAEDSIVWLRCDEAIEATAEERKPLDEAYDLGNDIPDGWIRTAYVDTWEFVMPFFTEAAADRYIRENSHRLGEARVVVESGYRNPEWEAIREYLMALPAPAAAVEATQDAEASR